MWKSEGLFTAFSSDSTGSICIFDWIWMKDRPHAKSTARQICTSGPESSSIDSPFLYQPPAPTHFCSARADESGTYRDVGSYSTICRGKVLELGVPFKDLDIEVGTELRLTPTVLEHGMGIGRYPHHGPATFNRPGDVFESTMWRV